MCGGFGFPFQVSGSGLLGLRVRALEARTWGDGV